MMLETGMCRTNGIALSPEDTTLYLTEACGSPVIDASGFQKIWKYNVESDGSVSGKTLFFDFALHSPPEATVDSDGMRCDSEGNLYVTRNGGGKVMVFSPSGDVLKEYSLSNLLYPTNLDLSFDNSDLYVVGRCGEASWGSGNGCWNHIRCDLPVTDESSSGDASS